MPVVTTASQGQCMHGGMILFVTTNAALFAEGSPVLLESDIPVIVGCPFTIGVVYSPCVSVQWQSPESSLSVLGAKVVTEQSIGLCVNAAQAPQGIATISGMAPNLEAL